MGNDGGMIYQEAAPCTAVDLLYVAQVVCTVIKKGERSNNAESPRQQLLQLKHSGCWFGITYLETII